VINRNPLGFPSWPTVFHDRVKCFGNVRYRAQGSGFRTRDGGAGRTVGRVDTGVAIFPTHDSVDPGSVARLAEERGHESLFFPEHTHIPAERTTPYPRGGELPYQYAHTFDLFVALTAAAMTTTRLRIGSGVCLVIERDPIITAKEVASVDFLSGGRFEFGVGLGWNREEMANHGTDPRVRKAILRERVEAMKEIWTHDEASYHGKHVDFERIWSWPKPAQRPHPPVLVGGAGPSALDRVLEYGDAWMPNHADGNILERAAELRARADRPIDLMVIGVPDDPSVLEAYEKAGFSRAVRWLPSAKQGPVERALDRFETAVGKLHGS
jgi:probable F420-dependent oxidoreductase